MHIARLRRLSPLLAAGVLSVGAFSSGACAAPLQAVTAAAEAGSVGGGGAPLGDSPVFVGSDGNPVQADVGRDPRAGGTVLDAYLREARPIPDSAFMDRLCHVLRPDPVPTLPEPVLAVPEPASLAAFAAGLGLLAARARRQRGKPRPG